MRDERFEVTVTFDERRGYIASASELRQPVIALSLGGFGSRSRCCPTTSTCGSTSNRAARLERDRRQRGGEGRASDARPR
jgi:hypothetical protein